MAMVTLGKTGFQVEQNSFGCLPLQRISMDAAAYLLHKAVDGGMNFFDTARMYSDSEEKVGNAFKGGLREKIVLATKSHAKDGKGLTEHLETSLRNLQTDYIDIFQIHNPAFCPRPGGEDGLYDALLKAQAEGKIRYISITNHRLSVAKEAIESGLYATLQFPYSYLSGPQEQELVNQCVQAGMGFIAMKGLAGGLIRNGYAASAFMAQQPNVVPIWGIQHEWELDQFLDCVKETPAMTDEYRAIIEHDRAELAGDFCRGCGYCMPCPVGIEINNCARMALFLRRSRLEEWLSPTWQAKMAKIEDCIHCGQCKAKCPYGLDTPRLLEENYKDYLAFPK